MDDIGKETGFWPRHTVDDIDDEQKTTTLNNWRFQRLPEEEHIELWAELRTQWTFENHGSTTHGDGGKKDSDGLSTITTWQCTAWKAEAKQRRIQLVTKTPTMTEKGPWWSFDDIDDSRRQKRGKMAKNEDVTGSTHDEKTSSTMLPTNWNWKAGSSHATKANKSKEAWRLSTFKSRPWCTIVRFVFSHHRRPVADLLSF